MARGAKKAAVEAGLLEEPWELPDGWRWERLQDVAEINPKTDLCAVGDEPVTFLGMAAVSEENGHVDVSVVRPASQVAKGYTRFQADDVLFAKITPCMENGKMAVVPELASGVGAGSTEFHVVRSDQLLPRLLFHFLVQRGVRQDARRNMTGTAGQMRVPTDYLRLMPVPVPPPDTQRVLAARIDELFAEIDDGDRALAEVHGDVETYSKSLLKAAFEGALTTEWRASNPPELTGAELLEKVLAARRDFWLRDPANRGRRYVDPQGPELSGLPELPQGWCWASLQQVAVVSGGVAVDAKRRPVDPVEVPYLRVANVQRGRLDLSVLKTISMSPPELAKYRLEPGDILLNEGGDRDKVGRGWVWTGAVDPCVHQNHVFKARPASGLIEPELVSSYLNELGRRFFLDESKQTTNLASISLTKVSRAPVPIPPIAEAWAIRRALAEAEPGVTAVGSLGSLGAISLSLRQSILAAAFRGDLVA